MKKQTHTHTHLWFHFWEPQFIGQVAAIPHHHQQQHCWGLEPKLKVGIYSTWGELSITMTAPCAASQEYWSTVVAIPPHVRMEIENF